MAEWILLSPSPLQMRTKKLRGDVTYWRSLSSGYWELRLKTVHSNSQSGTVHGTQGSRDLGFKKSVLENKIYGKVGSVVIGIVADHSGPKLKHFVHGIPFYLTMSQVILLPWETHYFTLLLCWEAWGQAS